MSKILILSNSDIGLYKFRKGLIQELLNQGNDIIISLPKGEMVEPLVEMGCKFVDTDVDRRKTNVITDFKLLLHYLKILLKIKPQMVITYTIKPNIYGGIVCRIMKIPYVINVTGLGTTFQKESLLKKFIIFLYTISCKRANVVFFENEENKNTFIYNKIVKDDKAYKLNGAGVDLDEYSFCEYPEDSGVIRFLFIGRIMKEKGVEELFEAAKRIKKEYNNVFFDVVGFYEEDFEDIVIKLVEDGIIDFYGFQKDVRPFIKADNCFVLPSYHEGMANTLLECAAMGRPIITTNIYGCKEAVNDGENGFLCRAMNSEDLYIKLRIFVNLSREQKINMGICSRVLAEKLFDKNEVIKRTISILDNVICEK
jgi:Glycosyltransferase